jgi:rhodanese-related sulfurtransferase
MCAACAKAGQQGAFSMPEPVSREEVQTLVHNGALLVEVLGPREYAEAHLPGAINIPLPKLNREATANLILEKPVVVYCHDFY